MKPSMSLAPLAALSLSLAITACAETEAPKTAPPPAAKPAAAKPAVAPASDPAATAAAKPAAASSSPVVLMSTSLGNIKIKLDAQKAPLTVANFLKYVDRGFYDGTIFHRTISTFMIQGGGFDTTRKQKPTDPPIKNEASNGLSNKRGTIAMARTSNPDSATAQFFVNVVDNAFLDYKPGNAGYCVFGEVIEGMDVVDKIKSVPVRSGGDVLSEGEPIDLVVIKTVTRAP